jgi:antitoxin (DNA-binding transcriptional repressor) of toxin-antitoxin stability system
MAMFPGQDQAMLAVKISELKSRLSQILDRVRRGETILVQDRDRVIARIEPAGDGDRPSTDAEWLASLESAGTVRRASKRLGNAWLRRRPSVKADVVQALLDERETGR